MSMRPAALYAAPRTCRLFWCYQCHRAVRLICSPASDIFCPRCYGRSLHEIDLPRPRLVLELTPIRPVPGHPHNHFPDHPLFHPPAWRRRYSELDHLRHLDSDDGAARPFGHRPAFRWSDPVPQRPLPPTPRRRVEEPVPAAARPGDYYTGANMNELIDELTQNDRPGPPPAPASEIESLPTVSIAGVHLKDGSQCPVCKEEFALGEKAKEMPCKHVYHSDCIVPWLNLHNSCPVCRFQLPAGGNSGVGQEYGGSGGSSGGGGSSRQEDRWIPIFWRFLQPLQRGVYHHRRLEEGDGIASSSNGNHLAVLPAFILISFCFLFFSYFV